MKHLCDNGTTENTSMSSEYTASCPVLAEQHGKSQKQSGVALPWLVQGFGEEALGALSNKCRLSSRVAPPNASENNAIDASLQGIYKLD
jgi:hypothetical protein